MIFVKNLINGILDSLDMILVRKSSYEKLVSKANKFRDYELSELIDQKFTDEYFHNLSFSRKKGSQLRQDLFVLSELGFKRNGYFVEFSATNGINSSNTNLMETKFGWNGILAEPAKVWHSSLKKNRSVAIEMDCVWRATDETLLFNEVYDKDAPANNTGGLSTIDSFSKADHHYRTGRIGSTKYYVKTISLRDMLKKHNAPRKIDYLSIDTEGSEYEILNAFNFGEYDIKVITCEHNYMPMREKIHALLSKNGYERKFSDFSLFDDWYVKR